MTVITVGTVIWAVALVVTLVLHDWLSDRGAGDWVWITVAGVGLGLLGIRIVRRRRTRLSKMSQSDPSRDEPAPNRW